jgi:hypothetical protein
MKIPRQGSSASTKNLARAAVEGRRLNFHFSPEWQVSGYLVGMDDFHWVIVGTEPSGPRVKLIHKSAPVVEITDSVLTKETPEFVKRVIEISESFRAYCLKNYLGRNGSSEEF